MHGIFENDYMVSGRGEVPWHGMGAVLDKVLTSDEVINEVRLTWAVEQTPIYTEGNIYLKHYLVATSYLAVLYAI